MKKVLSVILAFAMLVACTGLASAQAPREALTYTTPDGVVHEFAPDEIVTVYFPRTRDARMKNIMSVTSAFTIKDGVGYCGGSVSLYDSNMDFDYKVALQKLSGSTWSDEDYDKGSGTGRDFFESGFSLSSRGSYRCAVTAYVGTEIATSTTGGKYYAG